MDKIFKVANPLVMAVSSAWSLATIEQTLSIVILCLNIAWFLLIGGYKVYKHLKNGDVESAIDDIKETKESLETLKKEDKHE